MRHQLSVLIAAAALAACSNESRTTVDPSGVTSAPGDAHLQHQKQDIEWGPAPAVFPPGAEFAVLEGDPSKAEPFTVRLRFPNKYRIPPHTHPTTENVTVIEGTFLAGSGPQFVEADLQAYGRGGFASIPADHAHYAMARGQTVVQVHALGPFVLTYVNPHDNPAAR